MCAYNVCLYYPCLPFACNRRGSMDVTLYQLVFGLTHFQRESRTSCL